MSPASQPRGLLLTRCGPPGGRPAGGADGPEMLDRHQIVLLGHAKKQGGVVVRSAGDLTQILFAGPEKAIACALSLLRRFERYNREREDPAEKVHLRQAVHRAAFRLADDGLPAEHTEVLERVLEVAPAGRILATRAAYAPSLGKAACEFIPLGWEYFPGMRSPVDVFEVVPAPGAGKEEPDGR